MLALINSCPVQFVLKFPMDLMEVSHIYISEPEFPRISVSPTVEQCIMAIYPNISHYFEERNYPYMDLYVYKITTTSLRTVITPESLTALRFAHMHM